MVRWSALALLLGAAAAQTDDVLKDRRLLYHWTTDAKDSTCVAGGECTVNKLVGRQSIYYSDSTCYSTDGSCAEMVDQSGMFRAVASGSTGARRARALP